LKITGQESELEIAWRDEVAFNSTLPHPLWHGLLT